MSSFFGGGVSVPSAPPQSQFDPFGAIGGRQYAAQQYLNLLQNPSAAMGQPGFSTQMQMGTQAVNAGAAATGQLASGNELAQLQNLGQSTFGNYYQNMLNNLGTAGSVTTQNAAGATGAQYNAQLNQAQMQQQQQQQGWNNILGLGGLAMGAAVGFGGAGNMFSNLFGSGGMNYALSNGGILNSSAFNALQGAGQLVSGPSGYSIVGQ